MQYPIYFPKESLIIGFIKNTPKHSSINNGGKIRNGGRLIRLVQVTRV